MHQKEEGDKKVIPHFWNLNEDPALTGMIVHFIKPGNHGNMSLIFFIIL